MSKFAIDYSNVLPFIALDEIVSMADKSEECRKVLLEKTGKGNDFVDWVKWPITISSEEVERIIACSERLKKLGKYLVVIGIGGSYLGAKAGLSMLRKYYENNGKTPAIYNIKADVVLPCATQNDINLETAKILVQNGVIAVVCKPDPFPASKQHRYYYGIPIKCILFRFSLQLSF